MSQSTKIKKDISTRATAILTDPRCTAYAAPGHPERPERILYTVQRLKSQSDLPLEWLPPAPVPEDRILAAHASDYISHLDSTWADFDADTPYFPEIAAHARRAVGGALGAMNLARDGRVTMSLMRPPGHHATRNRAMGFCYLNSMAIAILEAQRLGFARVAVFDFDVHHGNGTEDILHGREGTAYYSVHQHPCYPGSGARHLPPNAFNYPVLPRVSREQYRESLREALEDIQQFAPDILGVSAGFDGYTQDPLASGTLETQDFLWLGQEIGRLAVPCFSILEGGYSEDLPELVLAFLRGLEQTKTDDPAPPRG